MCIVSISVRLEQIKSSSGLGYMFESTIPALSHRGNVPPPLDEDNSEYNTLQTVWSVVPICPDGQLALFALMVS